jgi:hypothetical protein
VREHCVEGHRDSRVNLTEIFVIPNVTHVDRALGASIDVVAGRDGEGGSVSTRVDDYDRC